MIKNIPKSESYKNYNYMEKLKDFKIIKYVEIIKKYFLRYRALN